MTLPPLPDRESFAVPSITHLPESGVYYSAKALRDHVTAAVLAEREACAKVCDDESLFITASMIRERSAV